MQWFNDLSIARKQLLGVSLSIVLTLVLGAVSYAQITGSNRQIQRITEQQMPSLRAIAEMFAWISELRTNELVLLDSRDYAAAVPGFEFARNGAAESNRAYTARLTDPRSKAMYAKVEPQYRRYLAANQAFLDAAKAGDYDRATAIGTDVLHPLRLAMFNDLNALKEYDAEVLERELAESRAAYRRAVASVIGLTVAASVLALLAGLYIARLVGRALGRATAVSAAIAQGRFDTEIVVDSRDEIGQLLQSMATMQDGMRRFLDAQQTIAREHEAGAIGHRIDAAAFPGAYGDMAHGVNELVDSHIRTQHHIIEIVARYARGDLSRDIDRMPGDKAAITDAIDGVKRGMHAANIEIGRLVAAAERGDFAQRGDEAKFEFVYRDMIGKLNGLMAVTDASLGDIDALLAAVADGDLTRRVERPLEGRFAEVAHGANRTVATLARIVEQIRGGTEAMRNAASEIAAGNSDLSDRTERQAASLEETASSMEELTSVVQANATNAQQASALATETAGVAERGGAAVGELVETVAAINESSRRISEIITVIDGIAFQTNILALNAAVEAARAGEQGRGFAVVAAEVRSLAQRSAQAAKEISQLIGESVERMHAGSRIAGNAGDTMQQVVASVKRVTDLIGEISAASVEQSTGIGVVNQAVLQMDEGTQQNAALVEQAAAAARSMEAQARALTEAVAVFATGQVGVGGRALAA
ncbi:MAG TPA: methyl-accepting chemotaxis protein [Lysobacter sp.]|nr:methyl-accepting chemotaxis protein [Lysobacter sp.]